MTINFIADKLKLNCPGIEGTDCCSYMCIVYSWLCAIHIHMYAMDKNPCT